MRTFYLVIASKSTNPTSKQSSIANAIDKYIEVRHLGEYEVHSFGWAINEHRMQYEILDELFQFIKSINDIKQIRILQVTDCIDKVYKGYEGFEQLTYMELLDQFTEGTFAPSDQSEEINYLKFVTRQLTKETCFRTMFQELTHAQKHDLVNSELGLLKVVCDNIERKKELVDFSIDIENINTLLDEIQERFTGFGHLLSLKAEISNMKKQITRIKDLIGVYKNDVEKRHELRFRINHFYQFISHYVHENSLI